MRVGSAQRGYGWHEMYLLSNFNYLVRKSIDHVMLSDLKMLDLVIQGFIKKPRAEKIPRALFTSWRGGSRKASHTSPTSSRSWSAYFSSTAPTHHRGSIAGQTLPGIDRRILPRGVHPTRFFSEWRFVGAVQQNGIRVQVAPHCDVQQTRLKWKVH